MKTVVSLVQFEAKFNSFNDAFQRAEKFIDQAVKEKAKFICFPEDFLTGALDYYIDYHDITKYIITELPEIFKKRFINLSQKYDIVIIAGAIHMGISKGKIVNRSYIFNQGKIVHNYDKVNLYLTEKNIISPGAQLPEVVSINGVKIGVVICKDIYYPNLFSHLAKAGAQIVFIPSYWSANCTEYQIYTNIYSKYKRSFLANKISKVLGQARAIENGIYIVFANCCGSIKFNNYFDLLMGKSFIASPVEGIIAKSAYLKKEMLITVPIDLAATQDSKILYDL